MIVIENARHRRIARIISLTAIPVIVVAGIIFFSDSFLLSSAAVAIFVIILFISGIEKRRIGTRRLVITAIMTALSAAGRFIPIFKPVTAITIISGMYLGCEAGFTVGAMSALISNFSFGQGPWTPFQMLSWGLIGFISGLLSAPLRRSRARCLIFGALSGFFYSCFMDFFTTVWFEGAFSLEFYAAALAASLPFAILYAVSNMIFLFFIDRPFGEKLERIKIKYGI